MYQSFFLKKNLITKKKKKNFKEILSNFFEFFIKIFKKKKISKYNSVKNFFKIIVKPFLKST